MNSLDKIVIQKKNQYKYKVKKTKKQKLTKKKKPNFIKKIKKK